MKFNIIDKFLYKLLFLVFILLSIVILDKQSIISLNSIKSGLNANINITSVLKKINGDLNIIDLGNDILEVSKEDYYIEENNGYYKYLLKEKSVRNQTLGNVIKISKINNLYEVIILDENNNEIIYSNLKKINVKIYQLVKVNEIIGEANNNDDNEYLYYFILKINEN